MTCDVCGIQYRIMDAVPHSRSDTMMGRSDSAMGIITLNRDMPPDLRIRTLIHEWLHGVLDNFGIETPETLIHVLATELHRAGFEVKTQEVP